MNPIAEDILMHYGMPRRSGRYPWGSGEDPYQHNVSFLGRVEKMRKDGFTFVDEDGKTYSGDTAIAKSMGLSTTQFRTEIGLAKDEVRMYKVKQAYSLRDDGLNDSQIGREMGVNESTVRSWFNADSERRMKASLNTAEFLKQRMQAENSKMIDVSKGVEFDLNVSKEKLDQALYILQKEGYNVYSGRIPQINNPGQHTTQKVLCAPGVPHKDIYKYDEVASVKEFISRDDGATFEKKFHYPESMDSKRLMIRYDEDGGTMRDGIVELRRGVEDLSLGNSRYSQVRILVDGTHYIKGMAVYSDDMPDGVDVIFNTNKKQGTPALGPKDNSVLKPIKKDDPDNPFGSAIKDAEKGGQYWYGPEGDRKLGLINKRADEGDWSEWADTLPSQFLAKQSKYMAQKQLNLAKADKLAEFDEICSLTNPTVKKHLLEKFADSCDAAAVHLKAAALPGQKYHVIVPINTLKDTEVYAPQYDDGTKLALIRYPHGGTFEIPILTVNNKNAEGRKWLGAEAGDGIGITSKNAEILSGADFDGDTVMCIPTHDAGGKVKIKNRPPLEGLKGFDPKAQYKADEFKVDDNGETHYYRDGREYKIMKNTGTQMGIISNLITDMTLSGKATDDEIAAAVRHSMVVIDAEKHKLDYKQSEVDNNIPALHKKYQGKATGGAATILSKSKGEYSVEKRQGTPKVNEEGKEWYDPTKPIGAKIYKTADDLYYPKQTYNRTTRTRTIWTTDGKRVTYSMDDADAVERYTPVKQKNADGTVTYTSKDGTLTYKLKPRMQQSTKMAETDDACTLVSKAQHPMEIIYADYANDMKALGNKARIEMVHAGKIEYNRNAKATYQTEYNSLMAKLNDSLKNAPIERAAQRMANAELKAKENAAKEAGSELKPDDRKKIGQRALSKYRTEYGSVARSKRSINITDREWEAIQAGAISENTLKKILDNTDVDVLRQRATPRTTSTLSPAKINTIKAMQASNYTLGQIAKKLGVAPSTVSKYLKGAV